jgi:hypothetical protein
MIRKLQEACEKRCIIINKKKSEHMIFGSNEKEDLPLEDEYISGVDKCKYLWVLFTKNDDSNEEINNKVNKGRNIKSVNSTLRDKNLRKITKKRIYKTMAKKVMMCVEWKCGM